MAEQAPSGGGFMKAFLPGLAIGIVVGGFAWAFLGPLVSNPPEPVSPTRPGGRVVVPAPSGGFDERAPQRADPAAEDKKSPEALEREAEAGNSPEQPAEPPAEAPK